MQSGIDAVLLFWPTVEAIRSTRYLVATEHHPRLGSFGSGFETRGLTQSDASFLSSQIGQTILGDADGIVDTFDRGIMSMHIPPPFSATETGSMRLTFITPDRYTYTHRLGARLGARGAVGKEQDDCIWSPPSRNQIWCPQLHGDRDHSAKKNKITTTTRNKKKKIVVEQLIQPRIDLEAERNQSIEFFFHQSLCFWSFFNG